MATPVIAQSEQQMHHMLRFQSLFNAGRAFAFPCDSEGHVDMDQLSNNARNNYLFARALVGRDFATPAVVADYH